MRILFTTYREKTIFQPMVPLAWAFRVAGHDVRFAVQRSFVEEVNRAGLTAVPIGRHNTNWRSMAETYPEGVQAGRAGLPAPYNAAEPGASGHQLKSMTDGYADMLHSWHKRDNFPLIAGLVDYARAWKPDLVIWEPTTYAGAIAACAVGAAHARLLWSIDVFGMARARFVQVAPKLPRDRVDPLADWLAGYSRKYGFEFTEEMITGQFTIDPMPPSLRIDTGLRCLPMQYVPYGGPAVIPDWLRAPADRIRIGLTLGTSATEQFGAYAMELSEIIDSLSELDVDVVATVAESEQSKLGRLPNNVRVVPFVPLHALAPTCSLVINHAGPGTFLTTARAGIPQLTLPWDFDEPELARRAAEHGASLTIPADAATGLRVRAGVERLLNNAHYKARATDLRDEIRSLATPYDLVAEIEGLISPRR